MIDKLLVELKNCKKNIFIQTHDFPDPDAIASAYGLQNFLNINNIASKIVYSGIIQRDALKLMISKLNIEIFNSSDIEIKKDDFIIIVDGCKGSGNVTDLPGFEIAVIDHHIVKSPDDVPFLEYHSNIALNIPKNVATALMIGISRDTDLLTRKVTQNDINAYNYLYKYADNNIVNSLLRNNIQLSDLSYFSQAISNLKTKGIISWLYFENDCDTNLMGILGDFILSAQEIELSIIFVKNGTTISISIRNENLDWNASEIIQHITAGIGTGGGHKEMAGGVIYSADNFSLEKTMNIIMKYTDD
ncbi:MAG: hypothetical protein B6229_10935 [Spirochaetaceae bacterium 4572_7]|nr:MAG: hypothetical protein B6229_10935 [Spirochaetaceae bacterium 4572_7]